MFTVMTKGGPLMWFILVSAILAIAVFFERVFHYHRAQIHTNDFVNGILNSLKRGNISEAVQDTARTEVTRLEHNLPILVTIAQITPLLGFLGTVWGMIQVFKVIENTQATTAGQLAGGVWQALLTTAGGLVVAIPSYIAYNYLVSRVQNLVLDMEKAANETVQYLARKEEGSEQSSKVVALQ